MPEGVPVWRVVPPEALPPTVAALSPACAITVVPPETVVQAAKEHDAKLVGLSALMTTTLPAMEETISQLRRMDAPPAVMVGGAVVTESWAASVGADHYAKDARAAVGIAKIIFDK